MSKIVSLEPSLKDFRRVSKYLGQEKGIREFTRITPERLKTQYDKGMMALRFAENCGGCGVRKGHPLACAVLWETDDPSVLELGTWWTHYSVRVTNGGEKGGIQKEIIREVLDLPAAQWRTLFGISPIPSFGEIVQEFEFEPTTLERFPGVENMMKRIGMKDDRIPSSIYRPSRMGFPRGDRILYIRTPGE